MIEGPQGQVMWGRVWGVLLFMGRAKSSPVASDYLGHRSPWYPLQAFPCVQLRAPKDHLCALPGYMVPRVAVLQQTQCR